MVFLSKEELRAKKRDECADKDPRVKESLLEAMRHEHANSDHDVQESRLEERTSNIFRRHRG